MKVGKLYKAYAVPYGNHIVKCTYQYASEHYKVKILVSENTAYIGWEIPVHWRWETGYYKEL